MYGYRGGKKEGRKYPTVANVREEFYNIHEGVPDADPTLGEIPLVSQSTFKLVPSLPYIEYILTSIIL